jgi:hypothetical protein
LNDASTPPRPAPPARPLDDPPLDFRRAAAAADIGVGSNAGGDVDAPVNDSPLHTSGMELNDSSSESADFRLVDRPLDRRRGAAPPSDASEFLFDCPRVDLDVEALPCARANAHDARRLVSRSRSRTIARRHRARRRRLVVARVGGTARSVGRSGAHPSIARPPSTSRDGDDARASDRAR